ncbi:hypothetical protein [Geomonas azotofigens]|uniref:hypothetical protein n=1 Tax=Geomonas azotofigens TaxID=2843196 RepID=UPI001C108695|nr:hypothetical protein [Geomonas azotofigens]MBU5612313.1 hypothetical protein [Geomonas azotofigens]
MFRRVVGFLIGFLGSLVLFALATAALNVAPRGPGWVFIMIGIGAWFSRLFSNPKKVIADSVDKVSGPREAVSNVWWSFEPKLRLALVVSAVWIVASFSIQDEYERNVKVILLPAFAVIAFYFGHRFLVQERS